MYGSVLLFTGTQIWFIGRTLASQAGEAGSTPVICLKRSRAHEKSVFPAFLLYKKLRSILNGLDNLLLLWLYYVMNM